MNVKFSIWHFDYFVKYILFLYVFSPLFFFSTEILKEHQRSLTRAGREMERERRGLETTEKKVKEIFKQKQNKINKTQEQSRTNDFHETKQ